MTICLQAVPIDGKLSRGVCGAVLDDPKCIPGATLDSPLKDVEECPDLTDNRSLSVRYYFPKMLRPHRSMLLPGVKHPQTVLNDQDREQTRTGRRGGYGGRGRGGGRGGFGGPPRGGGQGAPYGSPARGGYGGGGHQQAGPPVQTYGGSAGGYGAASGGYGLGGTGAYNGGGSHGGYGGYGGAGAAYQAAPVQREWEAWYLERKLRADSF